MEITSCYKSLTSSIIRYDAREYRHHRYLQARIREYPPTDPDLASSARVVFRLEISPRVEEILPVRVRGMRIPQD